MATLRSLTAIADVDRQTIAEIAAGLTAGWPVDSIVLYGSKARGDDTPESNIDPLVLTGRPHTRRDRPDAGAREADRAAAG